MGSFALAVGNPVAPADYPFPPRPSVLPSIQPFHSQVMLRADPHDLNHQRQVVTAWPGVDQVYAEMQTPGTIRVLVNGVELYKFDKWDYTPGGGTRNYSLGGAIWEQTHLPDLKIGDQVTITAIPERVSGDWAISLLPRQ